MGAIFGFSATYSNNEIEEIISNMHDAMKFRGSFKNIYRGSDIVLGVCQEADTSQNIVCNESKTIVAACEGEIYNFQEFQKSLKSGHDLPSSDNAFDIIPHLYEEYGKDFVRHLNGVFTIALWDDSKKNLYLIRDHLGSHSLFYSIQDRQILFATTIKALLKTGDEVSLSSIDCYFAATALSPPKTMFKNIFCLKPGHLVIYKNGKIDEYNYWPVNTIGENYHREEDDFAEEIRNLIIDSVEIRADYGGKYGSLISGGADTGVIAAVLSSIDNSEIFNGFSIAFDEIAYSDLPLQEIMYNRYNIVPHRAILKPEEFANILTKAIAYLDSPVNDVAFVGIYSAMELAKKEGCSVVFDGEGADELFCTRHSHGERAIQQYLFMPFWFRNLIFGKSVKSIPLGDSMWKKILRLCCRIGMTDNERRMTWHPCFHHHIRSMLLTQRALEEEHSDPYDIGKGYLSETTLNDAINIYHYGLIKIYLPDDLLFKNERMTSAHGLLNRTPFIDYRLVELALKVPAKYKMKKPTKEHDGTKLVYKKAIKGLIPDEILNRNKTRGFSQPTSLWYRNELKDFLYDILFSKRALNRGYLNEKFLRRLFNEHTKGKGNHDYLLNAVLIFELWMREYID